MRFDLRQFGAGIVIPGTVAGNQPNSQIDFNSRMDAAASNSDRNAVIAVLGDYLCSYNNSGWAVGIMLAVWYKTAQETAQDSRPLDTFNTATNLLSTWGYDCAKWVFSGYCGFDSDCQGALFPAIRALKQVELDAGGTMPWSADLAVFLRGTGRMTLQLKKALLDVEPKLLHYAINDFWPLRIGNEDAAHQARQSVALSLVQPVIDTVEETAWISRSKLNYDTSYGYYSRGYECADKAAMCHYPNLDPWIMPSVITRAYDLAFASLAPEAKLWPNVEQMVESIKAAANSISQIDPRTGAGLLTYGTISGQIERLPSYGMDGWLADFGGSTDLEAPCIVAHIIWFFAKAGIQPAGASIWPRMIDFAPFYIADPALGDFSWAMPVDGPHTDDWATTRANRSERLKTPLFSGEDERAQRSGRNQQIKVKDLPWFLLKYPALIERWHDDASKFTDIPALQLVFNASKSPSKAFLYSWYFELYRSTNGTVTVGDDKIAGMAVSMASTLVSTFTGDIVGAVVGFIGIFVDVIVTAVTGNERFEAVLNQAASEAGSKHDVWDRAVKAVLDAVAAAAAAAKTARDTTVAAGKCAESDAMELAAKATAAADYANFWITNGEPEKAMEKVAEANEFSAQAIKAANEMCKPGSASKSSAVSPLVLGAIGLAAFLLLGKEK